MGVISKQPRRWIFRIKFNIFAPCCSTEKVGMWSRALLSFLNQQKSRISPTEHRVTFWAEIAWTQTGMKCSSEQNHALRLNNGGFGYQLSA